jgi:hypothetical protein
MPEVSRPLDGDQFHEMAHSIYKLHTKGIGTPHANVRLTRDVLNNLATANYRNGFKDGYHEGATAQPKAMRSAATDQKQAVPVPEPIGEQDPDTAFDIRDLAGQSVVRVTLKGHVLLHGAAIMDAAKLVHALSQLGLQMAQYNRDQGAAAASGG